MATVVDILNLWNSIDLDSIVSDALFIHEIDIIEANQDSLLYGVKPSGKPITPKYARASYSRYKQTLNSLPPFGVPDLNLTGAFYKGFKVDFAGNRFIIYSTDDKAGKLEDKYGSDIYGVSKENAEFLKYEVILPTVRKLFKEAVRL